MSKNASDEWLYFSIEIKYFVAKKYFEFDEIKVLFIFLVVRSEFNQNMVLSNIYKMKTLPTKENFLSYIRFSNKDGDADFYVKFQVQRL